MFNLALPWVKPAIAGLALTSLLSAGWYAKSVLDERNTLRTTVATQAQQLEMASKVQVVTSTVLTERVKTSAAIQTKAKHVQAKILTSIPAGPDACVLPPAWRLLHDEATSVAEIPPATGGTDAEALSAQDAALTVAENYSIALDNADRLDKLQQWIEGVNK